MNSKERINVGKIYDIAREILSDKFNKHEEKDINNPLIRMMIVGEYDLMWDSLAMENKIKEQNPKAKIYSYKGAGHIFAGNGNWRDAAKSVVESAKAVAKTVSENGNWIVKAAIWGTALAVLIDLIVPMDPIPILPFSLEEEK